MDRFTAFLMMASAMAAGVHVPPESSCARPLGPDSPPNPFGQPRRKPSARRCPHYCAFHRAERIAAAWEKRARKAARLGGDR